MTTATLSATLLNPSVTTGLSVAELRLRAAALLPQLREGAQDRERDRV